MADAPAWPSDQHKIKHKILGSNEECGIEQEWELSPRGGGPWGAGLGAH